MNILQRTRDNQKALNIVLHKAKELGLTPKILRPKLTHGKSERAHASYRAGNYDIMLSTHDRFHDVTVYAADLVRQAETAQFKSSWQRAVNKFKTTGIARNVEYPSFDRDPTIGGIDTNDSWLHLLSTACHEVAHLIIMYREHTLNWYKTSPKSHGPEWKQVYAALREALVNPFVNAEVQPEPVAMAALTTHFESKRPKEGTTTGRVWALADANLHLTRKAFIEFCVNEHGISAGTASTQYSKWKKEQFTKAGVK